MLHDTVLNTLTALARADPGHGGTAAPARRDRRQGWLRGWRQWSRSAAATSR